jgi:predicted CXXCH cytochrome family protein
MLVSAGLVVLLLFGLLVALQSRSALGGRRGAALGLMILVPLGGIWGALEWTCRRAPSPLEGLTEPRPVSSLGCVKCHEAHHDSWHRSYHRTMTREATPENVKGDFNDASLQYLGVTSRMYRRGNRFFIYTVDLVWEEKIAQKGLSFQEAGPPQLREYSVDRLVGSHWSQQLFHRDELGQYLRLPLAYHIVEGRWVHINGAFIQPPEKRRFFSGVQVWNKSCVFCHNTRPSINPILSVTGEMTGYDTQVGELGIACEACHGAGERHVRVHQNPARRFAQHYSDEPDPTIVNPAKLSVEHSDQVCAHCHGARVPRPQAWDQSTWADPYLPGRDLRQFFYLIRSEKEQALRQQLRDNLPLQSLPPRPEPLDGKFWGDGTPLTTGIEYQGMAMSACYENGHGKLSCLSCHSMHHGERNHQLKDGMRTNEACFSCHETYRARLTAHTHHAADSAGSLCYNCHMPHQVYSLLTNKLSHRIAIPRVSESRGTGKPHACNLCHLDRSLGWTADQLYKWYGTRPEPLTDDERRLASSLLHLTQSDARTRAVVTGAFSWLAAQRASGRDWPADLLTRTLEHERYEAVRYLAYRALRSLHDLPADAYNYQGGDAERAAQLRALRRRLAQTPRPDPGRYPALPLTPEGLFADDVLERLLRTRNDPNVHVAE